MVVDDAGLLAWLMVALPVSLFAATRVVGRGLGRLGDLGLSLPGALVGVAIVGWLRMPGDSGWLAGLLASVAGAVLVTMLGRAVRTRSVGGAAPHTARL